MVEGEVGKEAKKTSSKKALKAKLSGGMRQNETEKPMWTEQKERAALLIAQDALTDELIAADVGIDRSTLSRWKLGAEFIARVQAILKEIHEKLVARGIAEKQNRIDALNRRWKLMDDVIRQRAENLSSVKGGGNTGLLVRQVKGIGSGEAFQMIEEYAVDTGLLKELREHEKQAAIELGEWSEKRELAGINGEDLFQKITVEIVDGHSDE
jgi:hypothetical protein